LSGLQRNNRWETAWIGLGSNVGDRLAHLASAVRRLRAVRGILIRRVSPVWVSAPAKRRHQRWFYNAVVRVSATLPPLLLLRRLKAAERGLGRRPGPRYGPRVIDLDLLLYGTRVLATPRLTVPHPELARRVFVLAPLAALSPRLRHPVLGVPAAALLRRAPGKARRLPDAEQRRFKRLVRSTRRE